jgi:hypothetical protein
MQRQSVITLRRDSLRQPSLNLRQSRFGNTPKLFKMAQFTPGEARENQSDHQIETGAVQQALAEGGRWSGGDRVGGGAHSPGKEGVGDGKLIAQEAVSIIEVISEDLVLGRGAFRIDDHPELSYY